MANKIFESTFFIFFRFKGYLIRKLYKSLGAVAVPTTILCFVNEFTEVNLSVSFTLPGLMGAALGILLVFRNNTAYERWWEARKVLGALVNTSRNFALQTSNILVKNKDLSNMLRLIAAFPFAVKEHLRGGVKIEEIDFVDAESLEKIKRWKHQPNAIVDEIVRLIKQKYDQHLITDYQMIKLIEDTDEFIDILGKCERIKNTPMPAAHTYLLKIYVWAYALIMPFGFISTLEWWTILAVTIIYYVAMSIVTIAEEIEEPFGHDPNDLPVDKIANNIYNNIKEIYLDKVNEEDPKWR